MNVVAERARRDSRKFPKVPVLENALCSNRRAGRGLRVRSLTRVGNRPTAKNTQGRREQTKMLHAADPWAYRRRSRGDSRINADIAVNPATTPRMTARRVHGRPDAARSPTKK